MRKETEYGSKVASIQNNNQAYDAYWCQMSLMIQCKREAKAAFYLSPQDWVMEHAKCCPPRPWFQNNAIISHIPDHWQEDVNRKFKLHNYLVHDHGSNTHLHSVTMTSIALVLCRLFWSISSGKVSSTTLGSTCIAYTN